MGIAAVYADSDDGAQGVAYSHRLCYGHPPATHLQAGPPPPTAPAPAIYMRPFYLV
jgi:hypothetical protein